MDRRAAIPAFTLESHPGLLPCPPTGTHDFLPLVNFSFLFHLISLLMEALPDPYLNFKAPLLYGLSLFLLGFQLTSQ